MSGERILLFAGLGYFASIFFAVMVVVGFRRGAIWLMSKIVAITEQHGCTPRLAAFLEFSGLAGVGLALAISTYGAAFWIIHPVGRFGHHTRGAETGPFYLWALLLGGLVCGSMSLYAFHIMPTLVQYSSIKRQRWIAGSLITWYIVCMVFTIGNVAGLC